MQKNPHILSTLIHSSIEEGHQVLIPNNVGSSIPSTTKDPSSLPPPQEVPQLKENVDSQELENTLELMREIIMKIMILKEAKLIISKE